ncbi:BgTH12-05714 [Blumeria graminis f. sp. triticale]|uniref:BgTH12-05714 n=1 Tax=Blumeria graminis f. sp. triticale TaxID=1689686 RepID=A0A9W4D447_BLUGR|nr:BgTH12-05714 [Blumeria graminis f. sp. triticale]
MTSSISDVAADRLWQFQLRKENKAILSQLQSSEQKRQLMLEENERRFQVSEEKMARLESKLAELERRYASKLEVLEQCHTEQQAQWTATEAQLQRIAGTYEPEPPSSKSPPPPLQQAAAGLNSYLVQATARLGAFPSPSEAMEIELVNAFIAGMSSPSERQQLTAWLQQVHPSTQKKDGRIEILCDWVSLKDALQNVGLLEAEKDSIYSIRTHDEQERDTSFR